jgi:phasin family protein
MISFPEQLSTEQKAQFDMQIELMRDLSAQAFATAEQVLALNINTTRASVERAANTVRHLASITDPRDLFTLGTQTQEQLSALFNYGRELFGITSGARIELARATAARPAPQPEPEPSIAVEQPLPVAEAPAAEEKPKTAKAKAPRKLDVVGDKPAAGPRAKTKPIAKAVSKATGVAAELPQPLAAKVDRTDAGEAKLLDSVPPAADVLELKPRKARRKK